MIEDVKSSYVIFFSTCYYGKVIRQVVVVSGCLHSQASDEVDRRPVHVS